MRPLRETRHCSKTGVHELTTCPCCDGTTIACDDTYPCELCFWNGRPHGYLEKCRWCGEPMGNERRKMKRSQT